MKNIIKVLLYTEDIGLHGTSRAIVNLANMFASKNYEVIFVYNCSLCSEHTLESSIKKVLLKSKRPLALKSKFLRILLLIINSVKLRKIINSMEINYAIAFRPYCILQVIFASIFSNTKTIISVRVDPQTIFSTSHSKWFYKRLYSLADGCVFQTKEARDFFPERLKAKSVIIQNIVDKKLWEIECENERSDIIGVGRLSKQKNWHVAISAFSKIKDMIKENFVIYGIGDSECDLKEYVNQIGLNDRIIFAGVTNEIESKICNAKIFVLSSDYEGTPNALIEALILGIPCVCTKFKGGGAENLIEARKNGLLVPRDDVDAFAKAMLQLLNDTTYAETIGFNAKMRARKEFDPYLIFEQWESFIISI